MNLRNKKNKCIGYSFLLEKQLLIFSIIKNINENKINGMITS